MCTVGPQYPPRAIYIAEPWDDADKVGFTEAAISVVDWRGLHSTPDLPESRDFSPDSPEPNVRLAQAISKSASSVSHEIILWQIQELLHVRPFDIIHRRRGHCALIPWPVFVAMER